MTIAYGSMIKNLFDSLLNLSFMATAAFVRMRLLMKHFGACIVVDAAPIWQLQNETGCWHAMKITQGD